VRERRQGREEASTDRSVRSGAIEARGGALETKGMVAARGGGHGSVSEMKGTRVRLGKERGWPAGTAQELEPGPWRSAGDADGWERYHAQRRRKKVGVAGRGSKTTPVLGSMTSGRRWAATQAAREPTISSSPPIRVAGPSLLLSPSTRESGAVHVLAAADSWRWDDAAAPGNWVV
jgi:hypothetical protein